MDRPSPSTAAAAPGDASERAPVGRRGIPADTLLPALLVTLVLGTIVAARPLVGVPMNDDFSYAHSARALAETGRIAYNGWGSPLLLPQAALGALIIAVAGFSYKALAAAGIALAGLCAAAMYALARRSGCAPLWAALATAALTLNPLFLAVAPSFMNDVPSLLLLLLALLALVRSLRSDGEEGTRIDRRWLLASVVLGIVAGSNRQVSWVAHAGALATLAVLLPGERRPILASLGALLVAAALLLRWQSAQPYTLSSGIAEGLLMIVGYPNVAFVFVYKFLNLLGLFLLPLVLPAIWARREGLRPLRLLALLALCLVPVFYSFGTTFTLLDGNYRLTDYGQYFTSSGVLVGGVSGYAQRPRIFPPWLSNALIVGGAVGLALALDLLADIFSRREPRTVFWIASALLAVSALIQIVASLPWYALRYTFDRYVLFLLPGLLLPFAARATAGKPPPPALGAAIALLAAFWITGSLFLGDYMSYTRARAALYERLRGRGVSPREIDGGVEFLGDTQIRAEGHVNNHEIQNPPGAFRKNAAGRGVSYLPERFPALDARYRLSTDAHPDPAAVVPDPVDSLTYSSPFPPRRRTMYVYEVRR